MTSRFLAFSLLAFVGCSAPERVFVNDNTTDTGSAKDTSTPLDTTIEDTTLDDTGSDTGSLEDSTVEVSDVAVDADARDGDASDAKDVVVDTYEAPPPEVTVTFPAMGDTVVQKSVGAFWNLGDYVTGSRTTTLPKVTSITGTFEIVNNLGSCTPPDAGMMIGSADMRVFVNGVGVGIVTIKQGSPSSIPYTFTFSAITGPVYNLRYEELTQVASGCGSFQIKLDVAKITLKG